MDLIASARQNYPVIISDRRITDQKHTLPRSYLSRFVPVIISKEEINRIYETKGTLWRKRGSFSRRGKYAFLTMGGHRFNPSLATSLLNLSGAGFSKYCFITRPVLKKCRSSQVRAFLSTYPIFQTPMPFGETRAYFYNRVSTWSTGNILCGTVMPPRSPDVSKALVQSRFGLGETRPLS